MDETFTKAYSKPGRAKAAADHHRWLASLGAPVPDLLEATSGQLVFTHMEGNHCRISDIPEVAALLGSLHAEAFVRELHAAKLDVPFHTTSGVRLAGFVEPRIAWLRRRRQNGLIGQRRYDTATSVISRVLGRPAAFYKDCNLRNVLVGEKTVLIDFDDLTLAPFGYDLAKLLVSAVMTHGPLTSSIHRGALAEYRRAVENGGGPAVLCAWEEFNDWLEIHALLTGDYLGRNGYRYGWESLGPWSRTSSEDRGRPRT